MNPRTIQHADALTALRSLPDASVDSVVTDPPAGIGFMGKDWDKDRQGRKEWIAWLSEIMVEAHRVLKPGGHALVWALPRTSHWTATALEDAGFEIRDCISALFGTGFPKSRSLRDIERPDLGTALKPAYEAWLLCRKNSAALGECETCGKPVQFAEPRLSLTPAALSAGKESTVRGSAINLPTTTEPQMTPGVNIDASAPMGTSPCGLEGGTCLNIGTLWSNTLDENSPPMSTYTTATETDKTTASKTCECSASPNTPDCTSNYYETPTHERVWLCRKPLASKTVAAQVLDTGTGALNIDACRVDSAVLDSEKRTSKPGGGRGGMFMPNGDMPAGDRHNAAGRWPSNLLLSHSPTCDLFTCTEDCPVAELDRQSGVLKSGGASRFFPVFKPEGIACQETHPPVPSAVSPCGLTETAIVPEHAAHSHNPKPGEPLGQRSTAPLKPPTLHHSPVQSAKTPTQKDTISTTVSPPMSYGCAESATSTPTTLDSAAMCGESAPNTSTYPATENNSLQVESLKAPYLYKAKPSRRERNAGLEGMPERRAHPTGNGFGQTTMWNGENGDDAWAKKNPNHPQANHHPTVKSVALMRWLCRLITPPGGLVVDMFMGSGTTGVACAAEGFRFWGCDENDEYIQIATARVSAAYNNSEEAVS